MTAIRADVVADLDWWTPPSPTGTREITFEVPDLSTSTIINFEGGDIWSSFANPLVTPHPQFDAYFEIVVSGVYADDIEGDVGLFRFQRNGEYLHFGGFDALYDGSFSEETVRGMWSFDMTSDDQVELVFQYQNLATARIHGGYMLVCERGGPTSGYSIGPSISSGPNPHHDCLGGPVVPVQTQYSHTTGSPQYLTHGETGGATVDYFALADSVPKGTHFYAEADASLSAIEHVFDFVETEWGSVVIHAGVDGKAISTASSNPADPQTYYLDTPPGSGTWDDLVFRCYQMSNDSEGHTQPSSMTIAELTLSSLGVSGAWTVGWEQQ